jgi:hypothetical protein
VNFVDEEGPGPAWANQPSLWGYGVGQFRCPAQDLWYWPVAATKDRVYTGIRSYL